MEAHNVEQFTNITLQFDDPTFNLLEWLGFFDESAKVPVKTKKPMVENQSKIETIKG